MWTPGAAPVQRQRRFDPRPGFAGLWAAGSAGLRDRKAFDHRFTSFLG